jgi:hypothetical protein
MTLGINQRHRLLALPMPIAASRLVRCPKRCRKSKRERRSSRRSIQMYRRHHRPIERLSRLPHLFDSLTAMLRGTRNMALVQRNPTEEKYHEMLKSRLQSRYWPRLSPARLVRQATILFKAMPRRLGGRAAETGTTRTKRHDLLRMAVLAID